MDLLIEDSWLSELESDGCGGIMINEWQIMNYSSAYPSSSNESILETSRMAQKAILPSSASASSNIISFEDCDSRKRKCNNKNNNVIKTELNFSAQNMSPTSSSISNHQQQFIFGGNMVEYYGEQPIKRGCNRTPLQAQDHVLAERKRREKLSQRFVALSAMVPGLNKLDKASVLGGAIKHLEQLQERIKMLEDEKKKRKQDDNSSSVSKRTRFANSSDEITSSSYGDQNSVAEIEVRTSDSNVMVRVYCENRSGIIKEILTEIEKLHLGIISNSVIPFSSNKLNITAIAQMNSDKACMSAQDTANALRTAIQKLI